MNHPAHSTPGQHCHDDQLPPPIRWLTRTLGSWRLFAVLSLVVLVYLVVAYVPLGSRYLWQAPALDVTRTQVLRFLPLHLTLLLLAVAVFWATLRSVAWRPRNGGAVLAAIGLSCSLIGLSVTLRLAAAGVVTLTPSESSGLALTTHYADPVDRVLVVQFGPNPPMPVTLYSLPRWNDAPPAAPGQAHPLAISLNRDDQFGPLLDYRARFTIVGYLAEAELTIDRETGRTRVAPVPADERQPLRGLPWPTNAVLALQIDSEDTAGNPSSMIVYLPFKPDGVDRLMPTRRYEVPGIGSVGLAFRPVARDLPFALAATPSPAHEQGNTVTLHIAETNPSTGQLMPNLERELHPMQRWSFDPLESRPGLHSIDLIPLRQANQANEPIYVRVANRPGRLIVILGLAIFAAGLLLWAVGWFVSVNASKRGTRHDRTTAL